MFLGTSAKAQTPSGIAFYDQYKSTITNIISPLDKAQVPHGFLHEFGYPAFHPSQVAGTRLDSNQISPTQWQMAYSSIESMRVFGSNALPTMSVMQAQMKPYVSLPNNSIALTMLSAKYASVKDNALTSNLLYQQNNQLYDVANRTQSPYQAHEAFVVAPVAEEFEGLYFSFVFRSDLLYSNYGLQSNQISTLQIDTDNGQGWQTVAWNTPLQVSYAQAGRKLLKYKFTFSNGNVREGHSYFKVKNPPQEVQRYATTEDFGLNFAGGNYYVRAVFQNGSYTQTKTVIKQ